MEGEEGARMREFRLLSFSFPALADGRRQRRSLEEEETGENRKQSGDSSSIGLGDRSGGAKFILLGIPNPKGAILSNHT